MIGVLFFFGFLDLGSGKKFFVQDEPVEDGCAEVKPKSFRQEWAEKHEDHPVFKKGLQVRVAYERLLHKLRYNQIGEVIGHKAGEVCVQLQESLTPTVIPAEILVSNSEAPNFKKLTTFLRTSERC